MAEYEYTALFTLRALGWDDVTVQHIIGMKDSNNKKLQQHMLWGGEVVSSVGDLLQTNIHTS